MLNDTCLLIRQIKNRQSKKISDLPNFNPSKYTRYTVLLLHLLTYLYNIVNVFLVINSINWTLVSSITQLNNTQYRIDCLTTTDINPSTDVYWLVNGVMKGNSMYTPIDVLTYNNTLLVYPDPLGVSVNVTCIATYREVNYSQSVILHGMIIL